MSALDVFVMSEEDARRITERIRYTAMSVRDGVDKLQRLVVEAQEGQAHVALGYASWTAYLSEVMGEEPLRLARDDRREVVQWLSGEGLSTRAIAPIVGVDQKTVVNDIRRGEEYSSPRRNRMRPDEVAALMSSGFIDSAEQLADIAGIDTSTGEVIEDAEIVDDDSTATLEPRPVVGLDGKTYTHPGTKAPRRKPLTDSARNVGWDLRKVTQRLQNIREDDRFARNKEEVAGLIRGHLMFTVEVCQDLLDEINQEEN